MILRLVLILLLITFAARTTQAHPGRGIVVDANGNVYVSDAVRSVIWVVSPDGTVGVHARDVHAHWLALERGDSLLADHVEYDPSSGDFLRGLVRIDSESVIERVLSPKPDPDGLDAGSFAPTESGIAVARDSSLEIQIVTPGARATVADLSGVGGSSTVNAIVSTGGDGFIVVKGRSIVEIQGKVTRLIAEVPVSRAEGSAALPNVLWGLASDSAKTSYTCDSAARTVIAVTREGDIQTIASSTAPWFPTGVAFHDGTLFILEHGLDGDRNLGPRVVVMEPGEEPRVLATIE